MGRFQRCQKDGCIYSWATKSTSLERKIVCLSALQKINWWIGRFNDLWRQIRGYCFALKSLENVKFLHFENFYISQAILTIFARNKHYPIWQVLLEDHLFSFDQFCTATPQNEWVLKPCGCQNLAVFSDVKKTVMFRAKHQKSHHWKEETFFFQSLKFFFDKSADSMMYDVKCAVTVLR